MPAAADKATYHFSQFEYSPVRSLTVWVDGRIEVEFSDSELARQVFEQLLKRDESFMLDGHRILWRRDAYDEFFDGLVETTIQICRKRGLVDVNLEREAQSLGESFSIRLKEVGFPFELHE